jgi:hypothetical protein
MNKLEITKLAVNVVVGSGVTKIVNDVIANNINDPEKVIQKVTTTSAAVVIGMMAKDATKAYTGAKIDSIVAKWNELKAKSEEAKQEPEAQVIEQ